jgi:bacillithiol biosynthesis cysteine-adding enzyme BshC
LPEGEAVTTQIPVDKLPSLSPLVHDYYFAYDKVREFFPGDFRDPAVFAAQIERLQARDLPRERLAAILKEQNQGYGCGPRTLQNIQSLARDNTCAVVTGQQVGLFSGPLYTIYKAMTAIKLAASLSERHGESVVPVFWTAGEDHDFAEVNHVDLLDQKNQIHRITYEDDLSGGKVPVGGLSFSSEVEACLEELEELTPPSEFKSEILSALSESYRPGRSFTEAFSQWMTSLFSDYGLVLIDPCHPDLSAMAQQVFRTEIKESSPSSRYAMEASERLRAKGYTPQVPQQEGRLNLFLVDGERRPIQFRDDEFKAGDDPNSYTGDELISMLEKSPQSFSPNVMLRPLVQDSILPTVAYVGGPGEIAYFAQLRPVYEHFDIPMPVAYPRKGFTFLEPHVRKSLEGLTLSLPDVWSGLAEKRNEMAAEEIPEALGNALARASENLDRDMTVIRREAEAMDPSLGQSVDSIHRKIRHQVGLLDERALKAAKRRQAIVGQRLASLENRLYPKRHLQERVFNVTPFLMKYGPAWLERLYETVDLEHYDHQVFWMGES